MKQIIDFIFSTCLLILFLLLTLPFWLPPLGLFVVFCYKGQFAYALASLVFCIVLWINVRHDLAEFYDYTFFDRYFSNSDRASRNR